uniref:TATA-box binding protein associated factor 3 n=1 Tax=Rousettus aegyptiacus TaxID=9407 RepID=A0A7J8EBJ4_ROUAE|nr:TATA-box binding protein associated factor 3 [Rousettus aegyptiacus]
MFYLKSFKLFPVTRSWICNILDSELFAQYFFLKNPWNFLKLICCAFDFVPDGRTDPILDDVGEAFQLMGVSLHELEDYIHNIEPVTFPHQIPSFPVSKNNVLQFPQPGSKDAEERKEYIPDYMPPIVSSQEAPSPLTRKTGMTASTGSSSLNEIRVTRYYRCPMRSSGSRPTLTTCS